MHALSQQLKYISVIPKKKKCKLNRSYFYFMFFNNHSLILEYCMHLVSKKRVVLGLSKKNIQLQKHTHTHHTFADSLRRSKMDLLWRLLLCCCCKQSLYFIGIQAGGLFSPSTNAGAGLTIVSGDGPCAIATDILVLLLFTTARCTTLLYFPLLNIYHQKKKKKHANNKEKSVTCHLIQKTM